MTLALSWLELVGWLIFAITVAALGVTAIGWAASRIRRNWRVARDARDFDDDGLRVSHDRQGNLYYHAWPELRGTAIHCYPIDAPRTRFSNEPRYCVGIARDGTCRVTDRQGRPLRKRAERAFAGVAVQELVDDNVDLESIARDIVGSDGPGPLEWDPYRGLAKHQHTAGASSI